MQTDTVSLSFLFHTDTGPFTETHSEAEGDGRWGPFLEVFLMPWSSGLLFVLPGNEKGGGAFPDSFSPLGLFCQILPPSLG